MASRLIHLRKPMRNERLVIALFRGAPSGLFGPYFIGSFETLSIRARETGLKILDRSASYAGFDETRLLAWIAVLQRQSPLHLLDVAPDFRCLLRHCADNLHGAGIHLDYRAINRHHVDISSGTSLAAASLSFPSPTTDCKQVR